MSRKRRVDRRRSPARRRLAPVEHGRRDGTDRTTTSMFTRPVGREGADMNGAGVDMPASADRVLQAGS